MTNYGGVVVPAIPPRPPQLSLVNSAVKPTLTSDPGDGVWQIAQEQLAMLPDELRAELEARRGDAWTRGFTWAPENRSSATVRDGCDFVSVDDPALPAPTGLALHQAAGGTLADAVYSYQVTAVNANGETTALAPVTITVSGGGGTASVTLTWNKTADTVTYNVYGRVGGSIGKIGTVGPLDHDQTATFTDRGTVSPGATPPSSNTTGGAGTYSNLPVRTVIPYLLVAADRCSSWGWQERDFKGRASRLLENAKHQAIEREFWAGTLAQAKSYPNGYLADSNCVDVTPGTVPSIARGLQILQDYLQQTGFGGQGMIHVQAQTAPNLFSARRVGGLLLDVFDNVIVPGSGYPGTGPVGNTNATPPAGQAWMYCSDLVAVREENEPTVIPDTFSEALDRGQNGQPNTIEFRAMKFAAAYFDGAVQAAVRVNLAT